MLVDERTFSLVNIVEAIYDIRPLIFTYGASRCVNRLVRFYAAKPLLFALLRLLRLETIHSLGSLNSKGGRGIRMIVLLVYIIANLVLWGAASNIDGMRVSRSEALVMTTIAAFTAIPVALFYLFDGGGDRR